MTLFFSVVQYFRSVMDVADLIRSVVADIPTMSVPLLDTIELAKS